MARTRSAAKQARSSVRKQAHNKAIKSKVHSLEKKLLSLIEAKKATEATEVYRVLTAAVDKAAKVQVMHRNVASRKKSRLAARLKTVTVAAA